MNIIIMDLVIKPMNKKVYMTPSMMVVDIVIEGMVCLSTFRQFSMSIDDVDQGTDYGYL